jgi:hypothetical protein
VFVQNNAIPDFVATLRNGSSLAQMLAAASLAELAQGYIYQTQGAEIAFGSRADCLRIAFGLPRIAFGWPLKASVLTTLLRHRRSAR